MEHLKDFLDASTIHGLAWISSTRRLFRLFWILIVIAGFSVAGYLIYESFYNWKQSPISTTVETVSISKITFPNVTVCPPKNLFLNLNYDIMQSDKVKFDKEEKEKLLKASLNIIEDPLFDEIMTNLRKAFRKNKAKSLKSRERGLRVNEEL